jgi:hypothetical protein
MTVPLFIIGGILLVGVAGFAWALRARQIHRWGRGYLRSLTRPRPRVSSGPITVVVAVCDHYEPGWGRPSIETERARVETWVRRYPEMARGHRDSWGRAPQHTFFFPEEEYRAEHLDRLAEMQRAGWGDVEVHLHHDADTSSALRGKLENFAHTLRERHGLLRDGPDGRPVYAFIHGNWALDNSSPDGRWCGVNDEITVLRDTGCYADFTFPSAPSWTQPPKINSIYYVTDDPAAPASHFHGVDVVAGGRTSGDLLLVQGPLTLNWRSRKWGVLPRIENGELSGDAPPTPSRVDLWVRQHIHVAGRPDWIFVKLHTHGAQEGNFEALLGAPRQAMLSHLESAYNDGTRYRLRYATAREMYDIIKAAESAELDENWVREHFVQSGQ